MRVLVAELIGLICEEVQETGDFAFEARPASSSVSADCSSEEEKKGKKTKQERKKRYQLRRLYAGERSPGELLLI